MKTFMPVLVERNCIAHPLLRPDLRMRLPVCTVVSLAPKKLFGYAAMKLQDASNPRVATYQQMRTKAESYVDMFGHALDCLSTGISVNADSETTGYVSELVGIGAGLAAACKVFDVNPNRVSRFLGTTSGKRMDYVMTARGRRCLLEVRGTTGVSTRTRMITEVAPKKTSIASQGYAAYAGAVTLYSQGPRSDYVTIVDPPGEGGLSSELDEFASMFEYYHNVYRLTHSSGPFCRYLESWLKLYRSGRNHRLPAPPTRAEIPRPRVSEEIPGLGRIRGTMFDLRILPSSIARFRTFGEATSGIDKPTWLVGTEESLDEIVSAGRWSQLLEYRSRAAEGTDDHIEEHPRDGVLISGFAIANMRLASAETDATKSEFRSLRRRFEERDRD